MEWLLRLEQSLRLKLIVVKIEVPKVPLALITQVFKIWPVVKSQRLTTTDWFI